MKKYEPSNGTEGAWFMEVFCHQCEHDRKFREKENPDDACNILNRSLAFGCGDKEYPEEWICSDNYEEPICTAFVEEKSEEAEKESFSEYQKKLEDAGQQTLFGDKA